MNEVINTDRLIIRPIDLDDVNGIHAYAGDKSIDMMMFLPNETLEDTKKFVDYAVSEWKKEQPDDREYVVLLAGKIIGRVNLELCQEEKAYEIGWTVHSDYRNKGYATEAANALVNYAFSVLGADKVQAHCDSRNISSEKVMKKIGMSLIDASGSRYYPKTGVTSGEYLYAINRDV